MATVFLLAFFGAAHVVAQAERSIPGSAHIGCATIGDWAFGKPVVFTQGTLLSPEAFQDACKAQRFAELSFDACRCGDDPSTIKIVADALCDPECYGDTVNVYLGDCADFDFYHGRIFANIYNLTASVTGKPGLGEAPLSAPATESPCSTSEQATPTPSPTATLVTPIGAAPETPVFSSTCLSEEVPSSAAESTQAPSANEASTSSGSQHDQWVTAEPTPEPPPASSVELSGPLPSDSAETATSIATQSTSPPEYVTDGEAHQTPVPSPPRPAELSEAPSQTTIWPLPPPASVSELEMHAPSQVPESKATQGQVSLFTSLGGWL